VASPIVVNGEVKFTWAKYWDHMRFVWAFYRALLSVLNHLWHFQQVSSIYIYTNIQLRWEFWEWSTDVSFRYTNFYEQFIIEVSTTKQIFWFCNRNVQSSARKYFKYVVIIQKMFHILITSKLALLWSCTYFKQ
jgi:hypothetical protein